MAEQKTPREILRDKSIDAQGLPEDFQDLSAEEQASVIVAAEEQTRYLEWLYGREGPNYPSREEKVQFLANHLSQLATEKDLTRRYFGEPWTAGRKPPEKETFYSAPPDPAEAAPPKGPTDRNLPLEGFFTDLAQGLVESGVEDQLRARATGAAPKVARAPVKPRPPKKE